MILALLKAGLKALPTAKAGVEAHPLGIHLERSLN